jgi:MFS family permease
MQRDSLNTGFSLPKSVWALGLVSLLMDTSSELVHSLLPVFMSTVLGASMLTIGFVEGIAEATASAARVLSGAFSDHLRKRKPLVVLGYGLSAVTKPLFPLASTIGWVFGARFADRVGKGIRGAPRDALLADIVPAAGRGAAYGLRQALDSVGAFLGPLLALGFMVLLSGDIESVLWVAVIPAVLAVAVLVFGVSEPGRREVPVRARRGFSRNAVSALPRPYWGVVTIGAMFTLARFSEAFLVLRAQNVGLPLTLVPLTLIVMNVSYALAAYPSGRAADRVSAHRLFLAGLAVLITSDACLALADSPWLAMPGAALWGLHMGLTQGLLSKRVADTSPASLHGTAFGIFHLVTGAAVLLASVIAGALWSRVGPAATFSASAIFATIVAVSLLAGRRNRAPAGRKSD